jgi:hypothetical protein
MGLAALHAAREPLSDCMTVVPFETAALADFRRPPTCGEDFDSTGGRPAFFERGGDFFLAAIRASCPAAFEVDSLDRAEANDMLPATSLPNGLPPGFPLRGTARLAQPAFTLPYAGRPAYVGIDQRARN